MKIVLSIFLILSSCVIYAGNNFSCPYGKQGACLDYNDKVCSSYSKCVSQNAVCFNQNTCGYGGFVCKSDYEDLSRSCKNLASDYDDLVQKHDEIADDYNSLLRKYKNLKSCIEFASSLDDAQSCTY